MDDKLNDINPHRLSDLIKRGIVNVMLNTAYDINSMTKYDTPEYKMHNHLSESSLSISDGERKYDVPHQTIVRWVQHGYIQVVGSDKNRKLINEADMAYCAQIYHTRSGRGKWLFNPDGTPYSRKSC